ncbi:MAG: Asp-tRNA(Asn)/Glu-tRNA(Gln) amidotransferase subunit GatC [Ruminococcaceae bacterium]|nr:Asp-tRNA(Asn)/Glu-tRNA(Gln) amidotransferase subunit GatC [Oscillospiraceae bacterium]
MDRTMIQHLCDLSRLNYEEHELDKLAQKMTYIVQLMDGIKEFDLTYDDTADNDYVSFSELRKDIAQPSFPTEMLLANAKSSDKCFVVPKVIE